MLGAVLGAVLLRHLRSALAGGCFHGGLLYACGLRRWRVRRPLPRVVTAGLGTVAATVHGAPLAAVVFACIEEEPVAVHAGALTDAGQIGRGQELSRRA